MFTQVQNIVPVTTPKTFADLKINDVFTRVRVKGYKTGTKPHTIYRVQADGNGGFFGAICGATNGQNLHNGDYLGQPSGYVKASTQIKLLGNDQSTYSCKC